MFRSKKKSSFHKNNKDKQEQEVDSTTTTTTTTNSNNKSNNNSSTSTTSSMLKSLLRSPRQHHHRNKKDNNNNNNHSSNISSMNSTQSSLTEKDTSLSEEQNESNNKNTIEIPNISIGRAIAASSNDNNNDLQSIKSKSRAVPSEELPNLYKIPQNIHILENGGVLFSFICGHTLGEYESEMVDSMINLSGFKDETKENYVPKFSYKEYIEEQQAKNSRHSSSTHSASTTTSSSSKKSPSYTFLLARCGYLLTGINLTEMMSNPSLLATLDYQRSCQPEGTKIWDDYDKMDPNNFRITKPIIPYIYSFTIQFRVSRVDNVDELQQLSKHLHIPVDGAIVLERTKRSVPPKEDATKKTKSVLVYTDLGHGVVLVSHLTVLIQSGLPEVVERILGTVGSWGLGETSETAWRTRKYLQEKLPYHAGPIEEPGAFFLDAASEEPTDDEEEVPRKTKDENGSDTDDDDFYDAVDLPTTDVLVH